MQKRFILSILLLLLSVISVSAQELTVKSFAQKTNDLSASTSPRSDNNGMPCALVKVQLATRGAQFNPMVVGTVDYRVNEYWVYVAAGSKHLEIKHPNYLTLDVAFADYGITSLESKTTYQLVVSMPNNNNEAPQAVTSQYLSINVTPSNAYLEIDGEAVAVNNGSGRKFVPFGEHTYTVQCKDYHTDYGRVVVNDKTTVSVNLKPAFGTVDFQGNSVLNGATVYLDNEQKGHIPLKLERIVSGSHNIRIVKPKYRTYEQAIVVEDEKTTVVRPDLIANFANVTLSVDNNAEIWINGEKKGLGSWNGDLEYGTFNIETKKDSHRPKTKEIAVTSEHSGKTIKLANPTPIYGSLKVETLPDGTIVKVDGEVKGETPLYLPNILIGRKNIELSFNGYVSQKKTVEITEGKESLLEGTLEKRSSNSSSSNVSTSTSVNKQTFTVKGVSFTMIHVEGGTFTMGATSEQGSDAGNNEKPTHSVTLSSFSIGETEVTQALWQAVMGKNPSKFKHDSRRPVEQVSWNDCQEFIRKLNSLTGRNFRLPTEAEWEYAARGGNKSKGYKYSGSNNLGSVAWYWDNSAINGAQQTHQVKQKRANELGIYDMSGNVLEWCLDWYSSSYYGSSQSRNPKGPSGGSSRVFRGGSWCVNTKDCRSSCRNGFAPSAWNNHLGLRLVLDDNVSSNNYSSDSQNTNLNSYSNSSSYTSGNKQIFTVKGVSFTMVYVQGGTFTMGATSEQGSDAKSDEKPTHSVSLSSYSIGETEVTQALWQAVMDNNPSHFTGNSQRPVEEVSWNDCQEFILKLNKLTGRNFRLPTEAEWEYAARGGNQSNHYKYSGSNNIDDVAWYYDNNAINGIRQTHPVKQKQPNELGLYDMSGNVYEWCSDWYDSSYYGSSPNNNPQGPISGPRRVFRGGSWFRKSMYCRSSNRGNSGLNYRNYYLGLRLALSE